MGRLKSLKEVVVQRRDPRADDDDVPSSGDQPAASDPTPAPVTASRRARASAGDDDARATALAGHASEAGSREDPFGVVGTLQAGCFRVEAAIAQGGFGVIYRALHTRFRAPVALKCLKIPGTLSEHEQALFLEKFNSEAELLFRLSKAIPEVVRPLHFGELELVKEFVPFIALEWLEGESLKTILERRTREGKGPLSLVRAVKLLEPVAEALGRAHRFPGPTGELSIVHCDIKPDNLFVVHEAEGDTFRILDFGISKVRSAATRQAGAMTGNDLRMFTPAHAAPEQWDPARFGQTGPWTDVHGLALTLLEVVTQRVVYRGDAASMIEAALDEQKRPVPSALGLDVDPGVDAVFARALAVDPRDRTASVERFWADLQRTLGMQGSVAPRAERPTIDSVAPPKKSFFDFKAITGAPARARGADEEADEEADAEPRAQAGAANERTKHAQGEVAIEAAAAEPAAQVAKASPASRHSVLIFSILLVLGGLALALAAELEWLGGLLITAGVIGVATARKR